MKANADNPTTLVSGSRLVKNTLWNILGLGLPLLVGLGAIPILIQGLGTERFGVLAIAWMVIGYFSIFDFGLGSALTKITAEKLGAGKTKELPELIWTGLLLMGMLGVIGAFVVVSMSYWLVYDLLNIPVMLQAETLKAFYILSLSIPLVISTTGLRGVLEAHQRFGLVNVVRVSLGLWTFLGPLMMLPFTESLYLVVALLALGRVIAWVLHLLLCFHVVSSLRHGMILKKDIIRPLLKFGGWMTVSNIVGPLMVYMDRFLIGAAVSMTAVAYYITPYEVVTKLWFIPLAVVGVVFPAFSTIYSDDKEKASNLFDYGTKYIYLVMFPLIFIVVTFAPEGMEIWLGKEFAENSTIVLQLLAMGVFVNSLARVPFVLIQGAGRPDIIALTHLAELPLYLILLWWLLNDYGIKGVAALWVVRIVVDAVVFNIVTARLLTESIPFIRRNATHTLLAVGLLIVPITIPSLLLKSVFFLGTLTAFCFWAWKYMLSDKEQFLVQKVLHYRFK